MSKETYDDQNLFEAESGMQEQANQATRANFSSRLGFVLATAGSAVGLGNIWRFPYLAASYGGGAFVVVYIILAVTFGYTVMISETAIGRYTRKSVIGAYNSLTNSKFLRAGSWITAFIPLLILPYYSVIGGWVCKYFVDYLIHPASHAAGDTYFSDFIGTAASSELWFLVFAVLTIIIILGGVQSGVERASKFMMPLLIIIAIILAIYAVTRPGAMEGVKYLFIPHLEDFSIMTVVAAMGQMFYSLSLAMGILFTYGSYMKKNVNIEKASYQVVAMDSSVALLAAIIIIPSVFAFYGGEPEVLSAGPSLMFITIPKVFASMGLGRLAGAAFFLLVLFAALTSSISLAETCISTFEDELHWNRRRASVLLFAIMIGLGSLSSLGYNVLGNVTVMGLAFLDFFDFLTNSVMMPIAALFCCILIIKVTGFKLISDEIKLSSNFRTENVYRIVIKYIAPIFLVVILVSSVLNTLGIITM